MTTEDVIALAETVTNATATIDHALPIMITDERDGYLYQARAYLSLAMVSIAFASTVTPKEIEQ